MQSKVTFNISKTFWKYKKKGGATAPLGPFPKFAYDLVDSNNHYKLFI